jgi:hypothetical protein
MLDLPGIRLALANQLATIETAGGNLRTYATVPGSVNPPAAVVKPSRGNFVSYQQTFDGAADLNLDVIVLVATGSDRTGQADLDAYLSTDTASSVWACVQASPTLGGAVSYAYVDRASAYGLMAYNGVEYLACIFTVIVGAP